MNQVKEYMGLVSKDRFIPSQTRINLRKNLNSYLVEKIQYNSVNIEDIRKLGLERVIDPRTINSFNLISKIKSTMEVHFGKVKTDFLNSEDVGFILLPHVRKWYSKSDIPQILDEPFKKLNLKYVSSEYYSYLYQNEKLPLVWIISKEN